MWEAKWMCSLLTLKQFILGISEMVSRGYKRGFDKIRDSNLSLWHQEPVLEVRFLCPQPESKCDMRLADLKAFMSTSRIVADCPRLVSERRNVRVRSNRTWCSVLTIIKKYDIINI